MSEKQTTAGIEGKVVLVTGASSGISDGLRQETDRIRVTIISPGVVESDVSEILVRPTASFF